MAKEPEIEKKPKQEWYTNNLEAHIIADMLRIESITTELREFKEDTKSRFDKIENWIIGIVAISFTTMLGVAGSLIVRVFG
jgi:hypothetical protein